MSRGGRNRIGKREKWPKKKLGGGRNRGKKVGRREKKKSWEYGELNWMDLDVEIKK